MWNRRSLSLGPDSSVVEVLLLFSFLLPAAPNSTGTTVAPGTDPLLQEFIHARNAARKNRRGLGRISKGRLFPTSSASTLAAVSTPANDRIGEAGHRNLQPTPDFCEQIENDFLDGDGSCAICDLTDFPDTVILEQCVYENCDVCVQDSMRGEICVDLFVEKGTLALTSSGEYDIVQEKACAQYSGGRTDQVCIESFSNPSLTSCSVTFNDIPCESCDACEVDCSNIMDGGLAWDGCQDVVIPPESPFFVFSNDTDLESCFREAVVDANGTISWVIADPHLQTFDGLEYDCQAAGEFVLVDLTGYGMEIHGRFEQIGGDLQASVTRAIVVNDSNEGRVQVSLSPAASAPSCDPTFYVDSQLVSLDASGNFANGFVTISSTTDEIAVVFSSSEVEVRLIRRVSASFGGCFFSVVLFIPSALASAGLQGLYGGVPNGDPADDWLDSSGNPIAVPQDPMDLRFSAAYEYSTTNWCVANEMNTLFEFESGESFASYNLCSAPYNDALETQVSSASAALVSICQDDLACLVDGVAGTEQDALAYLQDITRAQQISRELGVSDGTPSPTPDPATPTRSPRKSKRRKRNRKRRKRNRKRRHGRKRGTHSEQKPSLKTKYSYKRIKKATKTISRGGGMGTKMMGKKRKAMIGMMKKMNIGKQQLVAQLYNFFHNNNDANHVEQIAPSRKMKVSVIFESIHQSIQRSTVNR